MKKLISLLAAGLCIVSIVGCGSTAAEPAESEAAEEENVEPVTQESEIPERSKDGSRLDEIKSSGKLLIGISPDYAPFAFKTEEEDGTTVCAGSDIELGNYLAEELGVEPQYVEMEFEECLKAAKEKRVDLVLLGMLPEKDRESSVDFSDVYYEPGKQILIARTSQSDKYQTLDDFKDKIIEAQYGSLQAQLVTEQMPESDLALSGTAEEGVFQVRIGKADAIALDENLAAGFLEEHDDLAQTKVELSYESQGVVAGVVKGEDELLAEVNRLIADVTDQHLYVQWLDAATRQAVKLEAEAPKTRTEQTTDTDSKATAGTDIEDDGTEDDTAAGGAD